MSEPMEMLKRVLDKDGRIGSWLQGMERPIRY